MSVQVFPGGSDGKESACNTGDPGLIPGSGRSPGEGNCYPLQAMAPHSSTLAWKIPWTEEPGRLQSMGLLRVGHDWAISLSLFNFMHWRRNGNLLQYSCLENTMDRGTWKAGSRGSQRVRHTSDYCYTTIMSSVVVVMYGYESWTIKKAKHEIIDDFKL